MANRRSSRFAYLGSAVHVAVSPHLRTSRHRAFAVVSVPSIDRLEHITAGATRRFISSVKSVAPGWCVCSRAISRPLRAHRGYVIVATLVFIMPAVIVGLLVYAQPELILSVVDAETAAEFDSMYSESAESIGASDRPTPTG